MSSYKALAFGSYTEVKYHPFQEVDRELEQLLEPEFQVVSTEDYRRMNKAELAECRLVVSYTEFSEDKLPAEQSGALLAYVAGGGGCLSCTTAFPYSVIRSLGRCLVPGSPTIRRSRR